MRTTQRKAREVAEREHQLLQQALEMVARDGLHNLTLGRLAAEAGYSKGTIYNHFTCREDLLVALSTESARRQSRHHQIVAELPWDGVRALYGLTLAYMRHAETAPALFESSIAALAESVDALASPERLERRSLINAQMAQAIGAVVERTKREGAFTHPELTPEAALDALRSAVLGYAVTHLLSHRFTWGKDDDRLTVTASLMHGLGWPFVDTATARSVQHVIHDIVPAPTAKESAPEPLHG
ncbi:TetR/AcrR family transcriptional regulator [Streptomyces sp. NPDC056817]|uniref:TetR/AcrR family transcriptional regulator n=1 Tax=Streptomyces sp. NPDC056817 TaxID=3345950 RepID=UPI0036B59E48